MRIGLMEGTGWGAGLSNHVDSPVKLVLKDNLLFKRACLITQVYGLEISNLIPISITLLT